MEPAAYLPLTETTFYILLCLSSGPRHGYAIIKDSAVLSDNRITMSTGTLYGAIKRLLEQGWIIRMDDPQPNTTDRERKAYALTDLGRSILNAEILRLREIIQVLDGLESQTPA